MTRPALSIVALLVSGLLIDSAPGRCDEPTKVLPLPGEVFAVKGHTAFVIPAKPGAEGQPIPWVWYAPTLPNLPGDAEKWMFERFTAAGVAIAGIDVGESYGSPAGRELYTALYEELVSSRGFSTKPVLLGRSRGGLMTLSWAIDHPDKVGAWAGIYPVCNLSSYPGIGKAAPAYAMAADELQRKLSDHNPVDRIAALANVRVPLFAIHGDVDTVVPLEANSGLVKSRYDELGAVMQLIVPPGQGHNMWNGFFQSEELVQFVLTHARSGTSAPAPDTAGLFAGSGAKAGEITHSTAIVHVRLTSTPGQTDEGLIPGRDGEARIVYAKNDQFSDAKMTDWREAMASEDHSIQFSLTDLQPATRHFYRVELRIQQSAPTSVSETHSFVTAPVPDQRAAVFFHLTTCQDTRGESTYGPMAEQRPDFCISAGDTVYYDGEGNARTVPQAWQAYQKMFGLPTMKDYYRHVGGYFMKDDHDYRFNDADPFMKGVWVNSKRASADAKLTETRGNRSLDVAWLTHEEGIRVFRQVFPASDKPYRTFRWGQGVQIWLLENRDFRSPNDMPDGPEKSIWGTEQKQWLKETLLASDADHKVVISPNPIVGPDRLMKGDNHANLNGFWHEAQVFLDWLKAEELSNVVLMCGDRHWQYHSIDQRNGRGIHEFSCGPTSDEHVQAVPPLYDGVERPYAASRGGFVSVRYSPDDRSLAVMFHSMTGELLDQTVFRYEH